jgi:hypothetical protein
MLMSDSIRQMFIRFVLPRFALLAQRLDGVSPYQFVFAKISLVGRRSAEPQRSSMVVSDAHGFNISASW